MHGHRREQLLNQDRDGLVPDSPGVDLTGEPLTDRPRHPGPYKFTDHQMGRWGTAPELT